MIVKLVYKVDQNLLAKKSVRGVGWGGDAVCHCKYFQISSWKKISREKKHSPDCCTRTRYVAPKPKCKVEIRVGDIGRCNESCYTWQIGGVCCVLFEIAEIGACFVQMHRLSE